MLRVLVPLAAVVLTACARGPHAAAPRPTWTLEVMPRLSIAPKLVTARVRASQDAPCGAMVEFDWGNGSRSGHQADCTPGEVQERVLASAQMWLGSGVHDITVRVRWADGDVVLRDTVELH